MRHKLLTLVLEVVVIASLVIAGCAKPAPAPTPTPTPPAPAPVVKPIELSVNYFTSAKGQNHFECWVPWKEAVERRTGGKIKVTLYPGGALGKASEWYDITVSGRADISWGNHAGEFPLFRALNLPFYLPTQRYGTKITIEWMNRFADLCQAQHPSTKILWMHSDESSPLYMVKKPVRTLEDIKGKKILCVGGEANVLKALGAAPIRDPNIGEWYLSLERGVADGATMIGITPSNAMRLYEVAKYVTFPGWFGPGGFSTVMYPPTWKRLTPDEQEIILDEGDNWLEHQSSGSIKLKTKMLGEWKTEGVMFYDLSAEERARWEELYQPLYTHYVSEMEKKGLPGKEFLAICQEVEAEAKSEAEAPWYEQFLG